MVQIIAIGTTAADSAEVLEIAAGHPGVFAAVGVQPNHVAEAQAQDWPRIVDLAAHGRVVAIGETGLDRYWDTPRSPAAGVVRSSPGLAERAGPARRDPLP